MNTDPMIGQIIADRYQILELLGEGGMGRVYLAEHVRMGRKSAVKMISPALALSPDAVSRFNREAANASRINHPNVAQIYDFGETADGRLYLAMEYIEGETLRTMMERGGPVPPARAADITRQIADALAAAHHLGIVHRDLKPDNIMIARHHDGADWVKVVDFGIAKTVQGSGGGGGGGSQTLTTAGVSLGTPEYMSPEQLAGEPLDSRTDLYSLGLVAFNMLTARLPYPPVTSKETLVRRLTSKPQRLSEVAPAVAWPAALQAALDRALAPETADRYASVVDFARDVTRAVTRAVAPLGPRTTPVSAVRLSGPTQRVDTSPRVPPRAARVPTRRLNEPRSWRRAAAVAALGLVIVAGVASAAWFELGPSHAVAQQPVARDTIMRDTIARDTIAPAHAPDSAITVTQTAAPSAPSAPPVARQSGTTNALGTHAWIRANGDSGAARTLPPNATDDDRVRYLVDEIHGHLARAAQMLRQAQIPEVRSQFREVASDVQILRALYPVAAESLRVQQQVRMTGLRLAERVCPAAMADSSKHFPPNFRCENLLPNLGRGRQGAGGFARRPYP